MFVSALIFLSIVIESQGQMEPVLTQYMFNMQVVNPAYAGMWEKIGFSSLVRKQWTGINRSPLTEVFSFHTPLRNETTGLGLNVTNDEYGREKRFGVFGDYAYEVSLTPETRLRLGLKFGFFNYKNPLTQYQLYPDNQYDPAFGEDVDLRFFPNFGVGAFLYREDYYISFSVPNMMKNDFKANINNYSSLADIRSFYLAAGYVYRFITLNNLVVKPNMMIRATMNLPLQYDLGINFLLREQLWLGLMFRSANALSFVSQWIFDNNLRLGFAVDITYNEIFPYQYGTYEITLGFDMDFFGRSYIRAKYF
ncbi:MAG: type IX secretion system membrane protein PorP/SprF [Prolixibacteraceae bacterium]|nr:type IX secretion system membrane protein PorP/SprF [Prolixibacteraceae bacterium]